jgi:outer membrane lipoprotein-sorting protein
MCAFSLSAQTDFYPLSSVDDFKKQLSHATAALTSLECSFKQTKYLDILNEKVVSEGKFYYKKEQHICLDYTIPAAYQVVINNKKIKVTSEGKATVYEIGKNKMMAQMNLLMSTCMVGNLNALTSEYQLTYKENDTQYWVSVQPLVSNKSLIKTMNVYFDKKDFSVQELQMIEASNDYTTYLFTGKKKNSSIPDDKFNI